MMASTPGEASKFAPLPGARTALILLLIINLFNYIDRQVLAAVEPEIRRALLPGDTNAEAKTGWLSSAFLISYMVLAPLFGWMAERYRRWQIVAWAVAAWSLASGLSGLASTFLLLLLTRCLVGVGEAAYGPVAPTVISDLYPVKVRGKVLAWFYLAIPVGSALGYALGGQVTESDWLLRLGVEPHERWRWAFYLVVPPGLLLGLWAWLMREPPRGLADAVVEPSPGQRPRRSLWSDYRILLRTPSYVLNTAGMTAMTFALGGLAFWMAEYLKVHEVKDFAGISPKTFFGVLLAVAGLTATLAGGIAGDRLRARFPGSYFLVSGVAMLAGFVLVVVFLHVNFPAAWFVIFLAVFCLFFNTGPTNTILANVTHPSIRATGFAVNIFVIHLLGDVISPPIIGTIEVFRRDKLYTGFLAVSAMILVSGLFWLWGSRYLQRDTELASTRLP